MAYSKYSIIISVFFPWNSTANNYIPYVHDNLCGIASERESGNPKYSILHLQSRFNCMVVL